MPVSNDNQDFGEKDKENNKNLPGQNQGGQNQMTSDDLKGKQQVDGDIEKEEDRPADQDK